MFDINLDKEWSTGHSVLLHSLIVVKSSFCLLYDVACMCTECQQIVKIHHSFPKTILNKYERYYGSGAPCGHRELSMVLLE